MFAAIAALLNTPFNRLPAGIYIVGGRKVMKK